MKAQDFRGFLEQLGDLTEVQRSALASALAGKGSGNEAIALIEIQFSAAPACGHCKSESFGSWGHASGLSGTGATIVIAPSMRRQAHRWPSFTAAMPGSSMPARWSIA